MNPELRSGFRKSVRNLRGSFRLPHDGCHVPGDGAQGIQVTSAHLDGNAASAQRRHVHAGRFHGNFADGSTKSLVLGKDYKLSWSKNNKVSDSKNIAEAKVSFLGNYKGNKDYKFSFKVVPADFSTAKVEVKVADQLVYNPKKADGKSYVLKPDTNLFVFVDGVMLKNSEYSASFFEGDKDITAKGATITAPTDSTDTELTVKIVPKANNANYKINDGDSADATYKVVLAGSKTDITKATIKIVDKKDPKKNAKIGYTGKEITFDPTDENCQGYIKVEFKVGKDKITLIEDGKSENADTQVSKYFDISYANNVAKGSNARIILTPNNDDAYCGTAVGKFTIGASVFKETLNK